MFPDINIILCVQEFKEHLERAGKKDSTVYVYTSVIRNYINKGYNLNKLEDYKKFLEYHTIKKRSNYYYDIIYSFIKWYFRHEFNIRKNLLKGIKNYKPNIKDPIKKTLILNENDQIKIINMFDNPKHALIAWIQKETGVRAGDVIRLKRDDIKFGYYKDKDKISITMDITFRKKGDKISKIPIFNPYLIESIKKRINYIKGEEDFIFIDRNVVQKKNKYDNFMLERRNYELYKLELREICKKLGVKPSEFTSHDWRRNFAHKVWTDVLDRKDIIGLQRAMDHTRIETTLKYLRYSGLESYDIFKKLYHINKED